MMSDIHSSDDEDVGIVPATSKKRIKRGRMHEVTSKLRLQSHHTGPDCRCKKGCFEEVGLHKSEFINRMNSMNSNDEINSYLSGLITVPPVNRRRARKDEYEAKYRDASFSYRVRFTKDDKTVEVPVCRQAFLSLQGIGRGKIDFILKSLKKSGDPPKDKRGQHKNRKHKLPDETKSKVHDHIKSLKARESHYSLKDTTKTYLPVELNVKKLHSMFQEIYPDIKISYESYREIFITDFNISFGYPRTDTCSQCDLLKAKKKSLEAELLMAKDDDVIIELQNKLLSLNTDREIHLLKAEKWYKIKRESKKNSKIDKTKEAIVYDYTRNFPCPNITTNDVYYKRQLSVFLFNIHVMSTNESYFYLYPETVAKKGSDEVCSFLHHFYYNILDQEVTEIDVFSDSCAGQNKNHILFKFYHHLVHKEHRFKKVTGYFPIRGHSYNECDKNCALIRKKNEAELPSDWADVVRNLRTKPSNFQVIEVDQSMVKGWNSHLDMMYRRKFGCHTRPIRVFRYEEAKPVFMRYRTFFSGPWRDNPMLPRIHKKKKGKPLKKLPPLDIGEFLLPDEAYEGLIRIPGEKYNDLQALKPFCSQKAALYFTELPHN